jgi:hypothetical protein
MGEYNNDLEYLYNRLKTESTYKPKLHHNHDVVPQIEQFLIRQTKVVTDKRTEWAKVEKEEENNKHTNEWVHKKLNDNEQWLDGFDREIQNMKSKLEKDKRKVEEIMEMQCKLVETKLEDERKKNDAELKEYEEQLINSMITEIDEYKRQTVCKMEEKMREWESLVERYPTLTETKRGDSQESVNNQASITDSFSVNSLQPIPPRYDQVPDTHLPGIF